MADLRSDLHDLCLEELRLQFHGQDLGEGEHVTAFLLGDAVVRANLFADKNGILWVESVSLG